MDYVEGEKWEGLQKNRRGGRITGRGNTNHEMEMVKEQSERSVVDKSRVFWILAWQIQCYKDDFFGKQY